MHANKTKYYGSVPGKCPHQHACSTHQGANEYEEFFFFSIIHNYHNYHKFNTCNFLLCQLRYKYYFHSDVWLTKFRYLHQSEMVGQPGLSTVSLP